MELYKEDIIKLYMEYPFYKLEEVSKIVKDKYSVKLTCAKLVEILRESNPDYKQELKNNKMILKGLITGEDMDEIYNMYTRYPFHNLKYISKYINNKYNCNIEDRDISRIISCIDSSYKDTRKLNRKFMIGMLDDEQSLIVYNLYHHHPYYNLEQLVDYVYSNYNLNIKSDEISAFLRHKYGSLERDDESYYMFNKGSKLESSDKTVLVELLLEGYTQCEIAELLNISQAYISKFYKNLSKEEVARIEEIKFSKKLNGISLEAIEGLWYKNKCNKNKLLAELNGMGASLNLTNLNTILEDSLKVHKVCFYCNKKIDYDSTKNYCSDKCYNRSKYDNSKQRNINNRISPGGVEVKNYNLLNRIEKSSGICYLCESPINLETEDSNHPLYPTLTHKISIKNQGDNSEDNLIIACRCCSYYKSSKNYNEYSKEDYLNNRMKKVTQYYNRAEYNDSDFIKDCENGMKIKELAVKYGLSQATINIKRRKLGLSGLRKKYDAYRDDDSRKQEIYLSNVIDGKFKGTKPLSIIINDKEYLTVHSWRECFIAICEYLAILNKDCFIESAISVKGATKLYFSLNKEDVEKAYYLSNADIYANTNHSSQHAMSIVGKIMKNMNIDENVILIRYKK